jgi:hypothetical protein
VTTSITANVTAASSATVDVSGTGGDIAHDHLRSGGRTPPRRPIQLERALAELNDEVVAHRAAVLETEDVGVTLLRITR